MPCKSMIAWEESPRQFKMSKQLDEGKFGEDLARKFLNDPIIKVNHGISHYDDVTQDKSYQDKDTDFIVWKKNGKTFGLEAKVDSHNTGNFYLETSVDYFSMVPDALNEQRVARRYRDGIDPLWHTPGWVYRSGADQILYYFRTTQLLYIFSRVDVWFYAEKLMRGGIHLDPGIRKPKMYSAENISERNGSTLFFANGLCVNAEQTYKALGAQKIKDVRAEFEETLPEWCNMSGDTTKLETRSGTVIASGYNRIVIGDYGAFVEFSRAQANARHLKIKEGQSYRIEDPRYAEHVKYLWLTADDNSDVKVYDQKRSVEYADYKPGMLYVSVYEVFPAETDAGLS